MDTTALPPSPHQTNTGNTALTTENHDQTQPTTQPPVVHQYQPHHQTLIAQFQFSHAQQPHRCAASTTTLYNQRVGESLRALSTAKSVQPPHLSRQVARENNFFKSAKWSADGTCMLTCSNDNVLRVFETPAEIYSPDALDVALRPALEIPIGETVYETCWFPGMSSLDPATACFLSSSRDHPIHMWDAYTGKSRCTYSVVDHREQIVGPIGLTFNLDGSRIYAGYNNMIQIFETARPGRTAKLCPTTPTRKSKEGQKGVISCIAFNPDRSGLYAAGSFSRTVGLYSENGDELLDLLGGHAGGITQVTFSPDGNYLYTAARRDSEIICWDLRQTGGEVFRLPRAGDTNQRIAFDIHSSGRWLSTGDANGDVTIFDLSDPHREHAASAVGDREVMRSTRAHQDIVSSATFHPSWPLLLSSSGQRKFRLRDTSAFADSSSSSSDSDSDHDEDIAPNTAADGSPPLLPRSFDSVDNSLRVWHLPCTWTWQEDGSMPLEPQAVSLADEQPVQEPAVDGRSLEEVKADLLNRMGDVDGQRMGVVEQEVVVEGSVADVAME